jgi:hypothetical protein
VRERLLSNTLFITVGDISKSRAANLDRTGTRINVLKMSDLQSIVAAWAAASVVQLAAR